MAATANRRYKDSMFRDLFGSPERKGNALQLYNALNGTGYDDPAQLELVTLEDVIYMNIKNDVSFLVGDELVLWEHQSTPNPNMALCGLAYFSRLYSAMGERAGANLYGTRLVKLPSPRYVVFYSGVTPRPERELLRLSDAFGGPGGDLEVRCEVVNINPGYNAEVARACPALEGYSHFVGLVRMYNGEQGLTAEAAVARAIDDCVAEGRIADYLRQRRAEVFDMFLTEYDAERQRVLDREEGYDQGYGQGVEQGIEQGIDKVEASMRAAGLDPALVEDILERARGRG